MLIWRGEEKGPSHTPLKSVSNNMSVDDIAGGLV